MRKSIVTAVIISGIIVFSACGNKTTATHHSKDSVQTSDTLSTDSSVVQAETAEMSVNEKKAAADAPTAKSIEAGGTTITVGAPLAETLKKAKGARFEYNADFGVDVVVGNVMIRIPDEDITKEEQDFVNAIPSDMDPDIAFKISFIKPSAKIKDFEKI